MHNWELFLFIPPAYLHHPHHRSFQIEIGQNDFLWHTDSYCPFYFLFLLCAKFPVEQTVGNGIGCLIYPVCCCHFPAICHRFRFPGSSRYRQCRQLKMYMVQKNFVIVCFRYLPNFLPGEIMERILQDSSTIRHIISLHRDKGDCKRRMIHLFIRFNI